MLAGIVLLETVSALALILGFSIICNWIIAPLDQFPFLISAWQGVFIGIIYVINLLCNLEFYLAPTDKKKRLSAARTIYTVLSVLSFAAMYTASLNMGGNYTTLFHWTFRITILVILAFKGTILYKVSYPK